MRIFFALFLLLSFSFLSASADSSLWGKAKEGSKKLTEKDAYYGNDWEKMDEDFEKALNVEEERGQEKGQEKEQRGKENKDIEEK